MFLLTRGRLAYSRVKDVHECLHLHLGNPQETNSFARQLSQLLQEETSKHSKALWVHLNLQNLHLCQALLAKQFKIHHALGDSVVMYRWLGDSHDLVPKYSKFYAACGGVALVENRLLMVRERSGVRKGLWGIPSGYLEPNEPIAKGTEREFFEETGMRSQFAYMLGLREIYGELGSEYYFVNLLRLPEGEQHNLRLCKTQLDDGEWVHLSQLKPWIQAHSVGLQTTLLNYLSELHQLKFDFQKSRPRLHTEKLYSSSKGLRRFQQHHLADWGATGTV